MSFNTGECLHISISCQLAPYSKQIIFESSFHITKIKKKIKYNITKKTNLPWMQHIHHQSYHLCHMNLWQAELVPVTSTVSLSWFPVNFLISLDKLYMYSRELCYGQMILQMNDHDFKEQTQQYINITLIYRQIVFMHECQTSSDRLTFLCTFLKQISK